jgi:NAD(P)-dependent dehydrogenase (short-subunit alcohol dehydrogenase family)
VSAPRLSGTVAVVAVPEGAGLARRLVGEGATVVVTGTDGDIVGRLLADLADGPGRVAHFQGDVDSDAFVEFVAEQFNDRPPVS